MKKVEKNGKKWYNLPRKGGLTDMLTADMSMFNNVIDQCDEVKEELKKEKENKKRFIKLSDKMEIISHIRFMRRLMKDKKLNLKRSLENNKEIMNGRTVIKGTRITPETIFDYWFTTSKEVSNADELLKRIETDYPSLETFDIVVALIYSMSKLSYFKVLF